MQDVRVVRGLEHRLQVFPAINIQWAGPDTGHDAGPGIALDWGSPFVLRGSLREGSVQAPLVT